jgi:hypothetical protein
MQRVDHTAGAANSELTTVPGSPFKMACGGGMAVNGKYRSLA